MNNVEIKRANDSTGVWDKDRYEKAEYAEDTEQAKETSGKSLEEMVDDLLRAVGFDIDPDDGVFKLSQNDVKVTDNQIREEIDKMIASELKLANISEIQPELRASRGQF